MPKKSLILSNVTIKKDASKTENELKASVETLKQYVPEIDTEKNPDLLPLSIHGYFANVSNANFDIVDGGSAVDSYKLFINKPINIEHDRNKVVGVILDAYLTDFETDERLTEKQARELKDKPFSVVLSGVVWRVVNDDLAEILEENQEVAGGSLEILFDEATYAVLPNGENRLDQAAVVNDEEEKEKIAPYLKKSLDGNLFVHNLVVGEILPVGLAITETPASKRKGIASKGQKSEEKEEQSAKILELAAQLQKRIENKNNMQITSKENVGLSTTAPDAKLEITSGDLSVNTNSLILPINNQEWLISSSSPISITATNTPTLLKEGELVINKPLEDKKLEEKTANTPKPDVKTKKVSMKLTKITDITDENLQSLKASSIQEFVSEELEKAAKEWETKQSEKEIELQASRDREAALATEQENLKKQLEEIQATLQTLEKEKQEREAQETFSARMASFDETFELDDEDRKVIASQIENLNDEAYTKTEASLKVLLKHKSKEVIAAAKQKEAQELKASTETGTVETEETDTTVDDALEGAVKTGATIPNTTTTAPKTLRDKYKDAFKSDAFEVQFR